MSRGSRRWRQLTVWLHVLTSVGWMALAALLGLAAGSVDRATVTAATSMAHYLDTVLLAPLANASAATGLVLSLGTAWGLARHWWVVTKFVITLVQLYVGIFILSGALNTMAAAGAESDPPIGLLVGAAAMASAIAFQAWLAVAKPGGTEVYKP
ncbi:MAG: hypothetical protein ACRDTJ_08145, partial [Pseudonocardiaceae bacterium]